MKSKLIDLSNQRTQHLQAAETALKANNVAEYDSEMEKVSNLNTEISRVKTLLDEQEREILAKQPSAAEARDMAEERGNTLMKGGEVKITALEISDKSLLDPAKEEKLVRTFTDNVNKAMRLAKDAAKERMQALSKELGLGGMMGG